MVLLIRIASKKEVEVLLVKRGRIIKSRKKVFEKKLSETLWHLIADIFNNRKPQEISSAALSYDSGSVTFSGIRSAAAVLNTLGALYNIPLIETYVTLTKKELLKDISLKLKKRMFHKKLSPRYIS